MADTPLNLLAARDAIYNTLVTEKNSGRIQGVYAIGYSWLNQVNDYPYIGVYADGHDDEWQGSRRVQVTMHFQLCAAVQSDVSLEDAYTKCMTLMDDGNGNGIEPILRDNKNFTWGNLVSWTKLNRVRYYSNADNKPEAANEFIVYAIADIDLVQKLSYSGVLQ